MKNVHSCDSGNDFFESNCSVNYRANRDKKKTNCFIEKKGLICLNFV